MTVTAANAEIARLVEEIANHPCCAELTMYNNAAVAIFKPPHVRKGHGERFAPFGTVYALNAILKVLNNED